MAFRAFIFDIDGTLVDSNAAHVEAWHAAFAAHGHDVSRERITVEIGKGGDKLVPSIVGEEAEEREGEALRERHSDEFLAIAKRKRLPAFPRAREIFETLRKRGVRTALATSSSREHLEALGRSAGLDLTSLGETLVNADDIEETKPAPDLVEAAVRKLRLEPRECAMIGDTPYDAQASRQAGVTCIGVISGGNDANALLAAGASSVWRDIAEIEAHLDALLNDTQETAG
ncbi:MAG TPA: HAD family hydrolase [Gemmatimonadales bacterium]|nr:HAD family hydrolase [Gemmatimonadales bacterium]